MNAETKYWVMLSSVSGVGPKTFRVLLEHFGSPEAVLRGERDELESLPRITPQIAADVRDALTNVATVEEDLSALSDEDVEVLTWADDAYPVNLKAAADAPPILYVRGRIRPQDGNALAVVGSRESTPKALGFAASLSEALVQAGVTVVSGLAPGVDGAAHRAALDAGGRTLGVLGSGIRVIFPPEHTELAIEMAGRGAVLSELAPNTRASGPNLMARDRIISGLSLAVVVVQASQDSGSVDTAHRAQKQNRPVFVVDWPGNAAETAGNRALLRGGAFPLGPERPADIRELLARLENPGPTGTPQPEQLNLF